MLPTELMAFWMPVAVPLLMLELARGLWQTWQFDA
jgi:hypothetical protein